MLNRGKKEAKILELLDDGEWWYGLDLVKQSDGVLGRGTVYCHLSRLTDEGLVIFRYQNDVEFEGSYSQHRRRLYRKGNDVGTRQPDMDTDALNLHFA